MSSPVEMPDLPPATIANDDDETVLRQGMTDYRCAVGLLRSINVQGLSPLSEAVPTDVFLIAHALPAPIANFSIRFDQVGFVKGTKMWFWQGTPAAGWNLIPDTGDRLLAVSDGTNNYSAQAAGTQTPLGNWQQTGISLSVEQMPGHSHEGVYEKGNLSPSKTCINTTQDKYLTTSKYTLYTGGTGTTSSNNPNGNVSAALHNHGNTWRPAANIGCMGIKIG